MHAHKQLHVKRGALYNCTQCVFNVTKAAVLYHHYRYGHTVEEPELRYPEDSVIRAGHKDMHMKNDRQDENEEESSCPPMVWSYCKGSTPSFTKVYKCRYCPHTNRRRHNTIEHERMHSDHPEHQHHRQQQQRAAGSTPSQSPLHPCKRCTYVCNNAGVLASHVKVHSGSYGYSTIGFYDSTLVDVMQVRALEYVINLEKNLLLDGDYYNNSESDTYSNQEGAKYTELDDPELKFCSYCPARFFFISDLQCHIRFHKFRNWEHACDCCSFTARALSQVATHEVVHRDEYTERTAELLASGYPVSQKYPRPSEYPASVSDGSPRQPPSWSSPISAKCEVVSPHSTESDDRRQRRTKRPRDTDPNDVTAAPLPALEQQDYTHKNTKRRRKSVTSAIDDVSPPKTSVTVKTVVSAPTPNTQEAEIVNEKSPVKTIKTTKSYYVRQFTCDKCPGQFFKATALQYHKTLHGGTGQHHCRECDYAVSTYGNLVRHEYVHKDLPPRVKVKPIAPKSSKSKAKSLKSSNSSGKMPPLQTSKNTDNDSNLSDGTNIEDIPIDPEFGPSMLGNPAFHYPTTVKNGVARPKRYKCAKCPSAFDKRDQYAVHLTLHGAQDKYQCDKCDYSVKYTANYVQHQRKHARDAEIRKNIEQAADRAKFIKDQEEAAKAPRGRQKPKSGDQHLQPAEPQINLDPHDTKFRNEISDRQTAYELNTAYGATGIVGNILGDSDSALFRCSHCPYECSSRVHLNQHTTHHQTIKVVSRPTGPSAVPSKRPWKIACRFCTYRTQTENDLAEHTRVHFLRSTGATLSTFAASSTHTYDKNETIQPGDYVEFHGKRVIYNQQDKNGEENEGDIGNDESTTTIADPDTVTTTADADTTVTADTEDKNVNKTDNDDDPFFMFKDCSVGTPIGTTFNSKNKKYCPDYPIPPVLIDFNDNRTSSDATTKPQQQQTTAFVRFIKGGKRLEFLDNGSGGGNVVETGGKKKRGKKK